MSSSKSFSQLQLDTVLRDYVFMHSSLLFVCVILGIKIVHINGMLPISLIYSTGLQKDFLQK